MAAARNTKGFVRILPLLIVIAAVGIFSFLLISSTASFKGFFDHLFPKQTSHASIRKDFGVNISGAEFGAQGTIGVYGKDYIYPTDGNEYSYFAQKKLTLLRIPFTWERVQPQEFGALSQFDINGLKKILDTAAVSNEKVILDLHNFARYYNSPLTTADAPKLADLWQKLAKQFKDHPALYGYELMNEPHDLSEGSAGWATLAQAATNAIRGVDTNHFILIPGYSWQSARFWQDNNANLNINDPVNRLLYSAHQYFDSDYTGNYSQTYDASGAYPNIGVDRIQPFLEWLSAHNHIGILTEYGVPGNDSRWLTVLDNFENTLVQSDRIIGGTYWSAGPWWGKYPLSIEPDGSYPNYLDQPQMSITAKYPTISGTDQYVFGTIATDPSKAVGESAAGIQVAVLQLAWDRYEPSENTWNTSYVSSLKQQIQTFVSNNIQVVLDFGVQYPPNWVLNYPNSHFVNQFGNIYSPSNSGSGENAVNAVFNQTMRDKQEMYIRQVFADLGTNFYAVRLGWGNYGEIGFPNPNYQKNTNSYWAFDPIAQGQVPGIATGMTIDPVPGWIPGQTSMNHASAQTFINWYFDSLKNYHDWQISMVSKYFSGKKTMLYPSWGVRPQGTQAAINDDLNGGSGEEMTGEIQRGFDFARLVNGITNSQVVVYGTWIDSDPTFGNDSGTDQASWSPIHYLSYLAQKNRLQVWGENSGRNNLAAMQLSFTRMQQYGLIGLNWAFDSDLYSGQYATLTNYQNLITQYQTHGTSTAQPTPTPTPTSSPHPSTSPSPCQGADLNHDGKVDLLDYSILVSHFNQTVTPGTLGDINNNGVVDLLDYSTLVFNFGKSGC